ncbi:MAG: DUF1934 domain-containing protein [Bacillota bacterium]|nr:DUF1934 domain-containing protein [Bacillota bacterium]
MSTKVSLIDYLNNETVFKGNCVRKSEKNCVTYEFGNKNHMFIWKVYEKGLIINSISEVKVHLVLIKEKKTKGYIETEFGNIDLECYTDVLNIEKNQIEVRYSLVQGDEQIFHFCLKEELEWQPSMWN